MEDWLPLRVPTLGGTPGLSSAQALAPSAHVESPHQSSRGSNPAPAEPADAGVDASADAGADAFSIPALDPDALGGHGTSSVSWAGQGVALTTTAPLSANAGLAAGSSGGVGVLVAMVSPMHSGAPSPLYTPATASPNDSPVTVSRALSAHSSLWSEGGSVSEEEGDRPRRTRARPVRRGKHYPPRSSLRFLKAPRGSFPVHCAAWNGDLEGVQVRP